MFPGTVATARVAVVAEMATARPERAVATGSAMATLGAVAFESLATPRAAPPAMAATVAEEACVELLRRLHRARRPAVAGVRILGRPRDLQCGLQPDNDGHRGDGDHKPPTNRDSFFSCCDFPARWRSSNRATICCDRRARASSSSRETLFC